LVATPEVPLERDVAGHGDHAEGNHYRERHTRIELDEREENDVVCGCRPECEPKPSGCEVYLTRLIDISDPRLR
jgi:hypothetical protein